MRARPALLQLGKQDRVFGENTRIAELDADNFEHVQRGAALVELVHQGTLVLERNCTLLGHVFPVYRFIMWA